MGELVAPVGVFRGLVHHIKRCKHFKVEASGTLKSLWQALGMLGIEHSHLCARQKIQGK